MTLDMLAGLQAMVSETHSTESVLRRACSFVCFWIQSGLGDKGFSHADLAC